jgi:hypothetical protein
VHHLDETEGVFEAEDSLVEVPFAEGHRADSIMRPDAAERVVNHLGNADPFFAHRQTFAERSDLGQAQGQPGARKRGGQEGLAEPLPEEIALERFRTPPQTLHRPTIVTQVIVGSP